MILPSLLGCLAVLPALILTSGGKIKRRGGKIRTGTGGDPCCCGVTDCDDVTAVNVSFSGAVRDALAGNPCGVGYCEALDGSYDLTDGAHDGVNWNITITTACCHGIAPCSVNIHARCYASTDTDQISCNGVGAAHEMRWRVSIQIVTGGSESQRSEYYSAVLTSLTGTITVNKLSPPPSGTCSVGPDGCIWPSSLTMTVS